jgi:hypothetical protein
VLDRFPSVTSGKIFLVNRFVKTRQNASVLLIFRRFCAGNMGYLHENFGDMGLRKERE